MPVSRSNRKLCGQCGADVTFAKRTRGDDGGYRCAACAAAAATAWVTDLEQLAPADGPGDEVYLPASAYGRTTASVPPPLPGRRPAKSGGLWVVGGGLAAAVVVIACLLVVRSADGPKRTAAADVSAGGPAGEAGAPGPSGSDGDAPPSGGTPMARSPVAAVVALSRTAVFTQSSDFAGVRRDADQVMSGLRLDLIGEDSAYRGLSRRSLARRDLLALYVRVRGHCDGSALPDVDGSVRHALASGDTDLRGEDSAVRAIAANDQAAFALLGVWCQAADGPGNDLTAAFGRCDRLAHATTDSAPQAIDGCAEAVMRALAAILSARGEGAGACVDRAQADDVGETSAWRSATRYEQANLDLLLLAIDAADPAKATEIRSAARSSATTDDSALRAQEDYLQGQVDALYWLVNHP